MMICFIQNKFSIVFNFNGNVFESKYHFETKKIHFTKNEYIQLRDDIASLSLNNNLYLIKGGKSDEK